MSPLKKGAAKPLILAPAGGKESFMAAIAAGADAVYCGLKQFSARMNAENFTVEDLIRLSSLAHSMDVKVYIALNTLVKPDEINSAGKLIENLSQTVHPDAIIIQDLSIIPLARQAGYQGELHLSTLSNVSFPKAMEQIKKIPEVTRVVTPRELNIDEVRTFADACPSGKSIEIFVHGALCYGVSGRCYWSSFFGGKSGLRGRCVQPCRRVYSIKGEKRRYFSCQDLSLDVLAKVMTDVENISAWKIEGRKKGPHYVFYTVRAYRLFRDHGKDPEAKKEALNLLDNALGRKSTHYNFLPQRPQSPVKTSEQTGSGLFLGRLKGSEKNTFLIPRQSLLTGDLLRIGYEDEPGHTTYRVTRSVPKKGRLTIKLPGQRFTRGGTPVFIVDRREKELKEALSRIRQKLENIPVGFPELSVFKARLKKPYNAKDRTKIRPVDMHVKRSFHKKGKRGVSGIWLTPGIQSKTDASKYWWWLPPVVWPENEDALGKHINHILARGGRNFVLNSPWQTVFFNKRKGLNLWAGPFCNIANPLAIECLASFGFSGVIVSPELGKGDYLKLVEKSMLPLGIVLTGNWPLCISRTIASDLKVGSSFRSPRGEEAWVAHYGSDYWTFPNWNLDLEQYRQMLVKSGFSMFVHLEESIPKDVKLKKRPGLWNWNLKLL